MNYCIIGETPWGDQFIINEDLSTEKNYIEHLEHPGNLFDDLEYAKNILNQYKEKFDPDWKNTYNIENIDI